jgi:hypothetical protein
MTSTTIKSRTTTPDTFTQRGVVELFLIVMTEKVFAAANLRIGRSSLMTKTGKDFANLVILKGMARSGYRFPAPTDSMECRQDFQRRFQTQ